MKRKFLRAILCIAFCVLFVVTAVPFAAFGATVDAKLIDSSDVYIDLKNMGIDPTKYQKDPSAKHARMLHFLEYGYDYGGDQRDYGLYVYVYNPSGKEIDIASSRNYIQLQTRSDFNVQNGYRKMQLEKVSMSLRDGYEHVFYKFKVKDASKLLEGLRRETRIYEITSVELRYKDSSYDLDSKVAARYQYTGYMPYHGINAVAQSTLRHKIFDTFVLELDLHPATWKTSTSDKGAGYQYELFSTYFSVPNDVIKDFGDPEAPTKGLIAVDGVYEEYKVGGVLTTHQKLYDYVLPWIQQSVPTDGQDKTIPFWFFTSARNSPNISMTVKSDFSFNQIYHAGYYISAKRLPYITNVMKLDEDTLEAYPPERLEAVIDVQNNFSNSRGAMPYVDSGCKRGFQDYSVKKDSGDLALKMANLASSYKGNGGGFRAWFDGNWKLYNSSLSYSGIDPIRVVKVSDVARNLNTSYISQQLFVEECYVNDLQSETYSAALQGKTTYLIRFAVRDYYCEEINVGTADSQSYGFGDGNYYFEKTVFKNFDVLSLTWQNERGDITVIPVAALPIDIVGSITPPAGDDEFPKPIEKKPEVGCAAAKYHPIFIVLAAIAIFIAINWLLSLFGLSIGKIFSALGRGISTLFNFSTTQNERRRRHRREDDEHAWAKEDREYKRRDYAYKDKDYEYRERDYAFKEKDYAYRDAEEERAQERHASDMRASDDRHEDHEWNVMRRGQRPAEKREKRKAKVERKKKK